MFVRMKLTKAGSRNGIKVENFHKGETYDMSDAHELAKVFVDNRWAEPVEAVINEAAKQEVEAEQAAEEVKVEDLDDKAIPELKAIAKVLGVDVTGAKKKPDFVAAIKAHLEAKGDE